MKRINLTGKRFGRLVVVGFSGQASNGNALWQCQCDCGKTMVTEGYRLRHGLTSSCGCYRAERMRHVFAQQQKSVSAGAHQPGAKNHSGVVGVSFDRQTGKWNARLFYRGKLILNKRFEDFEAAVAARKRAEKKCDAS
ncbi:hypothetical protein [Lacticaseibacillus yichunensis]|uniref:Alcohol dehydrogenase n=1 Tax=Lacticaseibacillus yichunensis TaxID=2486015 RepID=A0ABW4CPK2_9LACO|nr:hypothetical protein [Lacticaseibacillus yichunensis]